MVNSLRTTVGRGITVLIGSAVFALVASGTTTATVTHGAEKVPTTLYTVGAYTNERDARATESIEPRGSIELLGGEDLCDITPAC